MPGIQEVSTVPELTCVSYCSCKVRIWPPVKYIGFGLLRKNPSCDCISVLLSRNSMSIFTILMDSYNLLISSGPNAVHTCTKSSSTHVVKRESSGIVHLCAISGMSRKLMWVFWCSLSFEINDKMLQLRVSRNTEGVLTFSLERVYRKQTFIKQTCSWRVLVFRYDTHTTGHNRRIWFIFVLKRQHWLKVSHFSSIYNIC